MQIQGWKYYNHAAIPTPAPHEEPVLTPIETNEIWQLDGKPLLARWTTDFDCGHETNWWYVIKDTPFDISELKAKRRYEINKGIKNFNVKLIDANDYKEELCVVQKEAFLAYPEKYRPNFNEKSFKKDIENWRDASIFGAFSVGTDELAGYAMLTRQGECIHFNVLKTRPRYEKYGVNAALVFGIVSYFENELKNGNYISDGARSINHETNFQDYLEKYFGFRKAYCRLNIEYPRKIKLLIKMLYPLRRILNKFDYIGKIHLINSVLKMEEIARDKQ